jgi:uncharacterized protein (TIGR02145 family)
MKKVLLVLTCFVSMMITSLSVKAQNVTITLSPGWNWISYTNAEAMDIDAALGEFAPMDGDIISSKSQNSRRQNGRWRGQLQQFTPGFGYMYYSSRSESVTLVFAGSNSCVVSTSEPTDITATSAVCGGIVTIAEGNHIFARGICWGTEPDPTIDGDHIAGEAVAGEQSFALDGLTPGTTYYVRAYVVTDNGLAYGEEQNFTTASDHAYVDLGLPSGLLWATCNVGADNPEDYGDYFAWGETQPKDYYDWSTYQYCNGGDGWNTLTKYCNDGEYGYNGFADYLTTLLPEDDAATANWGEDWRMPTKEEWEELYNNTTVAWTTQNGVYGRLFTASNGNSLFLPAAGYRYNSSLSNAGSNGRYWSSSLFTGSPSLAWYFFFRSDYYGMSNGDRCYSRSVRPVRSAQN